MKKVYATQDGDGHWYVIPFEMKDEFAIDLEDGEIDDRPKT